MKLGDLIRIWRSDVDDQTMPQLWSDEEAYDYANDAQNEACRRARLLVDTTTTEITTIDVVAEAATYGLDPRVLFVRKARFAGSAGLQRMSLADMEAFNPTWEDSSPGTPQMFICDVDTGTICLWPPPAEDGTLIMTVVRDPLVEMNDDDDVPEIAARYHRSLRHWMTYRACMKPDDETFDPKKAASALALFEEEFGKKSSAIEENWVNRNQTEGDGSYS